MTWEEIRALPVGTPVDRYGFTGRIAATGILVRFDDGSQSTVYTEDQAAEFMLEEDEPMKKKEPEPLPADRVVHYFEYGRTLCRVRVAHGAVLVQRRQFDSNTGEPDWFDASNFLAALTSLCRDMPAAEEPK